MANRYVKDDYEKAITFLGKNIPQYVNEAVAEKLEVDIFALGFGSVTEFLVEKREEIEKANDKRTEEVKAP